MPTAFFSSFDRQSHTYVIGATGTGKSTLLVHMALGDIERGEGVCFLDPHGEAVDNIAKRIPPHREQDVIYWDLLEVNHPFGFNVFECRDVDNPLAVARLADTFVTTFRRVFPEAFAQGAPRMEELLRNLALTFIANQGYTLAETTEFLRNKNYRRTFFDKIEDIEIKRFWEYFTLVTPTPRAEYELIAASLNKLGKFVGNAVMRNIVGQASSSLDFVRIMNESKILLVNLPVSQLGEENTEFFGTVIVGKLLEAALSRGMGQPRFHLFVDEFQRFTTSAFPVLQAEARKFNIDITIAHQWRSQLDEENRGSTLTSVNKIIFQVNPDDAKELAWIFDTTPPPAEGITRIATKPVYNYVEKVVFESPEWEREFLEVRKRDGILRYRKQIINLVFKLRQIGGEDLNRQLETLKKIVANDYLYYKGEIYDFHLEQLNKLYSCIKNNQQAFEKFKQEYNPSPDFKGWPLRSRVSYLKLKYNYDIVEPSYDIIRPDYDTAYALTDAYQNRFAVLSFETEPYLAHLNELINILEELIAEEKRIKEKLAEIESHAKGVIDKVETGLYEPVYDWMHIYRPQPLDPNLRRKDIQLYTKEPAIQRLRADVANEIASELINLNYFTARAKLMVDGKLTETTLNITPLPAPPSDWRATNWNIKQRSVYLYGRDRKEVEQEIRSRLPKEEEKKTPVRKKEEEISFGDPL